MRPHLPSFTSMLVSGARGLGDFPGDASAATLLPAPLGRAVRTTRRLPAPIRRAVGGRLVDHLAHRTAAIDEVVRAAVHDGARQLVILGAGLDARAHRLPELAGLTVFEVDYPSTQAWKRRRAARLPASAARVVYVPLDFERDELGDALACAHHDARAPSVWIWEAVLPYLAREAIDATLEVIAERSAPGSVVAITYVGPDAWSGGEPGRIARAALAAMGEPLRTLLTPAEIQALLERHGLSVTRDEGRAEWVARYGSLARRSLRVEERLAVATRA